ncbi:MAG: YdcF family protein [Alphaproteobacteria bacterium]|nr:YdcF family protein [Alphaproteobacteria bacterium]
MPVRAPLFRRPDAPRRRPRPLLIVVLVATAAWLSGFFWYAATIPTRVDEPLQTTDAIIVLTGGSRRVETGLLLLVERLAPRLFVSGVNRDVERADILRVVPGLPADLVEAIALGYGATDTIGNSVESAHWMRQQGLRSLRLVTANFHMRRSLLEFRHALPEAELVPHPVFPENFKRDDWWRYPGSAALIASEYSKYLAALLRHTLSDALSRRRPGEGTIGAIQRAGRPA